MLEEKHRRALSKSWWFAGLRPALQEAIAHRLRVRTISHGGHVYVLGEPPNGLHCVLDGEVRSYAYPYSSRPFITRILRAGDWCGSLSMCDMGPQPNDAVAFEAATMGSLNLADIDAIAADHPNFWRQIALMNGREHRFCTEFVMSMLGRSMTDRLSVLLRLGSIVGADGVRVIKITQDELAAVAGFSRQQMNTLLRKLEAAGRIECGYGHIKVLDERLVTPTAGDELGY